MTILCLSWLVCCFIHQDLTTHKTSLSCSINVLLLSPLGKVNSNSTNPSVRTPSPIIRLRTSYTSLTVRSVSLVLDTINYIPYRTMEFITFQSDTWISHSSYYYIPSFTTFYSVLSVFPRFCRFWSSRNYF